ncbi:caldesmon-like [Ambystoma mexicanum]|uniref:caldesmon-like n=1 Tax=Ambystoma mexicanum TaxID=8296 RepID=UPI0037E81ACB
MKTSEISNGKEPPEALEKHAERPAQKCNKDKPKRDTREPTSIKKHMNPRDQLNVTEPLTKSERKADHSKIPQELENANIQQAQKKVEKTTKTNELMTKWITVTDKKPSMKENSNTQINQKGDLNQEPDESTIDISNISTYSIEASESEIPPSMTKKRMVSFAENELPAENRKENQYKKQMRNAEQKREKLEDSEHKKDRISPERKTLFRLSKRKLNKYDYRQRSNEEAYPKSSKRLFENERQEEKAKRSDRRYQQTYLTPIGQNDKASEIRTRRSQVTETFDNRRRDKSSDKRNRSNQRPLDQSFQQNRTRNLAIFTRKSNSTRTLKLEKRSTSEEKTILNRRTMLKLLDKFTNGDEIKSIDINIVEFAHKGRTDSIFLHITSQTVKKLLLQMTKEFLNRGYLLRETTPEERGQKIQKTNETKQKDSYEDKTSKTNDWIKNTSNRKYNLKEKRKYPASPRNHEHTKKVERETTSKLKGSSSAEITKETRKEISREDHHIKRYRNDDDEDTEKTKSRKINGPIRPQEGTGTEKTTMRKTTSTQNRLDLVKKKFKKMDMAPSGTNTLYWKIAVKELPFG